ncbi:hypothetical protein HYV91_02585 [Candidatus Wolfebacteria bacterium]|nr:hypothetical protein [Candidatus Wolfebacteria bacterium]
MVNVNKKYIGEILKRAAWQKFLTEIRGATSEKDLLCGLNKFLSGSEINLLERRLATLLLLERGLTYRKIGEIVDVSPDTISFVKRGLKRREKINPDKKLKNIPLRFREPRYKRRKIPAYKGRGRWDFLDQL